MCLSCVFPDSQLDECDDLVASPVGKAYPNKKDAGGEYDPDLPLVIQQRPEKAEAEPYDSEQYHLSQLQDRDGLISKIAQRIRREKQTLESPTAESITFDAMNDSNLRRIINWKIINHGRQTIIIV